MMSEGAQNVDVPSLELFRVTIFVFSLYASTMSIIYVRQDICIDMYMSTVKSNPKMQVQEGYYSLNCHTAITTD